MKDCQTVKYDCLIDLLGMEQEGAGRVCQTHARSARNRHGQVKFTAVDSLLGCKHSTYFPPFLSIFSLLSYYNYKFPLFFPSLFSQEFLSHKTATVYISSVLLSRIFTTFLHLLLLGQAVSLIQQWIQHVNSKVYSPLFSYCLRVVLFPTIFRQQYIQNKLGRNPFINQVVNQVETSLL